jgi:hypothetical protein
MSLFNSPASSAPAPVAQTSQTSQPAPAQPAQPAAPALVPLTEADVKAALPSNMRSAVTQGLVDLINNISTDPDIAENIRNNFVGYSAILKEGKFKTEDYLNAVTYVSYKMMNYSNEEAYARTFPTRHANLLARGASKKDISAYVSAYHKGKLVNLIMEQTMVPTWVLNQDMYQRALQVQYELMTTANSEKVRTDAANSILTHLKKPETIKGQISLDIKESSGMTELKNMMSQLAQNQQTLIQQGQMKTVEIAAQRLIDKEGATDV